jgi:hypothetical protein
VEGRAASLHYTAEVASSASASSSTGLMPQQWIPVYVFETKAKPATETKVTNGYFKELTNWTAS